MLTVFGCSNRTSNTNSASQPTNSSARSSNSQDNVEELGMLVRLAIEPDEVVWLERPVNQGQRRLTAVLRYTSENAAKVEADAVKHGQKTVLEIEPETWFPSELISQSDFQEGSKLRGSSYPANDFVLNSYSNGTIIRIAGTDFFILEMLSS